MPPSNDVADHRFSDAHLDRVEDDLDRILRSIATNWDDWHITHKNACRSLTDCGHTLRSVEAMLDRLVNRAVFERRRMKAEDGYGTTRDRWVEYVAQRRTRSRDAVPRPVPSPGSRLADILSRQGAEKEQFAEEQRCREEAARRERELLEAVEGVRSLVRRNLPEEDEEHRAYFEELARRLRTLVHLLSDRGVFEGVVKRIEGTRDDENRYAKDARECVVELLRVAATGTQQTLTPLLRASAGLPFSWLVNDWLGSGLWRAVRGGQTLAAVEDGVCWPFLPQDEPDPIGLLLGACDKVSKTLD